MSEGMYDDSVGLVIGDGSAGSIMFIGMGFVPVAVALVACGSPASGKVRSLLRRCFWVCLGLPCRSRGAACCDLEGD